MLYLVSPELSGIESEKARDFMSAMQGALAPSVQHSVVLSTPDGAKVTKLATEDGIAIFASANESEFDAEVVRLVERAHSLGLPILPIALDQEHRWFPGTIELLTPFPVDEKTRGRALSDTNVRPVARQCAWSLLAHTRPTYARREIKAFLSYSRDASDPLVKGFDEAFRALGNSPTRDDRDFRYGEEVRTEISTALSEADILVLFDSAQAIESEWVSWELEIAAAEDLPIVWIDSDNSRSSRSATLGLGDDPDLRWSDYAGDMKALADAADRAARSKLLVKVPEAEGFVNRLGDWARYASARLVDRDPRMRILELTYPEGQSLPRRRPRKDVIQVYARRPRTADCDRLTKWLREENVLREPSDDRDFDAAVIASAAPSGSLTPTEEFSVVQATDRYLEEVTADPSAKQATEQRSTLLLFGAFPTGSEATEHIVQAARNMTSTWLRLGGIIAFGGHPTITWHVVHAGEAALGNELAQTRVHLYQSRHWEPQPKMDEIKQRSSVTFVDAVKGDQEASLELMRTVMINDSNAVAAVAIGGRTTEGGTHFAGIPAEVAMARKAGIPVFLLGATGGATAQLAATHQSLDPPFGDLNNAPLESNEQLLITDDYTDAAVRIWHAVVA